MRWIAAGPEASSSPVTWVRRLSATAFASSAAPSGVGERTLMVRSSVLSGASAEIRSARPSTSVSRSSEAMTGSRTRGVVTRSV